jgi:hypothetical protein
MRGMISPQGRTASVTAGLLWPLTVTTKGTSLPGVTEVGTTALIW